jgi:hypothetical protein
MSKNVQYKVFLVFWNSSEICIINLSFFQCTVAVQLHKSTQVSDKEDEENDLKIIYQKNLTEISKPETDGSMNTAFKN